MKLRSLNNATIWIEGTDCSLLIDPWIVGELYHGAWSPIVRLKNHDFLKSITHVFISHIHEDHWDKKTLSILDRNTAIYIPKMPVNKVLKRYIEDLGFSDIRILDYFSPEPVGQFQISVVPPMNAFGQELDSYIEGYETDATNIDTSLLVQDEYSGTTHLFLCDNTPYDLDVIRELAMKEISTLWYPFNSYAQDYPVCYGFDESELSCIHKDTHEKRKKAIKKCIQALKPKYYFPNSADFVINGPVSEVFNQYTKREFTERKAVAETYTFEDISESSSQYLSFGDILQIQPNSEIQIERDVFEFEFLKSKTSLPAFVSSLPENFLSAVQKAFFSMLQRCDQYGLNLSNAKDWVLTLRTENHNFDFSYKLNKLLNSDDIYEVKNRLTVQLTNRQLSALLNREIHWNNAMIGCHLQFKRDPNIYCQEIYKSLNFLHL